MKFLDWLLGREEKQPSRASYLEVTIAAYGRMAQKLGPSVPLKKNEIDFYDLAEAVAIIEGGGLAVYKYMLEKGLVPGISQSGEEYLEQPPEERHPMYEDVEKYVNECIAKQAREDPEGLAKAFKEQAVYDAAVDSFVATVKQFAESYRQIPRSDDSHTARVIFERALAGAVRLIGRRLNKEEELLAALRGKEK